MQEIGELVLFKQLLEKNKEEIFTILCEAHHNGPDDHSLNSMLIKIENIFLEYLINKIGMMIDNE